MIIELSSFFNNPSLLEVYIQHEGIGMVNAFIQGAEQDF